MSLITVGARVRLDAPTGHLVRGCINDRAALCVLNGARGVVVGASGSGSYIVAWDAIGPSVGVSVSEHWLMPLDPAAPAPTTTTTRP